MHGGNRIKINGAAVVPSVNLADLEIQRESGRMHVVDVPLNQIAVGKRRRQDYGDIAGLANGIKRVGLLEPIVIDRNGDGRYRLVAGGRRLQAAQMLQWKSIPAHLREHLTDAQMRDVELEENENRKSLTERERTRTFASSKKLVENAERAAEVEKNSATPAELKRGPKAKYGVSREVVAADIGVAESTLRNAEHHIETAEAFPWMQGNAWRQSDVLRMRERLEEIKPEAREQAMAIVGSAKLLDPDLVVRLIENIGSKSDAEREELFDLSQSDDPRNVSLALARAAELPPLPDPRLGVLDKVLGCLNAAIKPYPKDPLTPRLMEIRGELQTVRAAVKEVSYDAQREQQKGAIQ